MGLKLLGLLDDPPLCRGLTLASFHFVGNEPVLMLRLQM